MIKASDEIFNEKPLKGFDIHWIISMIALLTDMKVFIRVCQAIFDKCFWDKNLLIKSSEQGPKTRVFVSSAIFVQSCDFLIIKKIRSNYISVSTDL
jgi:hypothetical protein